MRVITAVIAIVTGILVLGGYFADNFYPPLKDIQFLLLNWAVIMAGAAAIVGVLNMVFVHADKIRRREKGNIYSALLVVFLTGTILFGLINPPTSQIMQLPLQGIILPVEAALMGILTITLLYAAIRVLRRRADATTVFFLFTVALIAFGSATLPFGNIPIIGGFAAWVKQVLAVGGARGILVGVALGTLTTGLRVLFGLDRPYGGQ